MNDQNMPFDQLDDSGNSVMHLAVTASEKLENPRPVRQLVFNAAPKDLKNMNGETPADVARGLEDEDIGRAVIGILERKQTFAEWIQMEKPNQREEKSYKLMIFAYSLIIFLSIYGYLFLYPLWTSWYEIGFTIAGQVLSLIFFTITVCSPAGHIKPHKEVDFLVSELS